MSHEAPAATVRQAAWPCERAAIERFRYEIYVAEQGKLVAAADHDNRRLADGDDEGASHYLYEVHGMVSGYARLHLGVLPRGLGRRLGLEAWLMQEGVFAAYLSKVMLKPDRRGGFAFAMLMRHLYRDSRLAGVNLAVCHANVTLADQYQTFGWQKVGEHLVNIPGMAPQVPMVLVPGNRALLRSARPLLYDVELEFDAAPLFQVEKVSVPLVHSDPGYSRGAMSTF